uniref:Uncharacterized protein n=1 Tax=Rhizophora mucronata TaxID=61149 RepID=A0A2P2N9C3_RHIMU
MYKLFKNQLPCFGGLTPTSNWVQAITVLQHLYQYRYAFCQHHL